VKTRGEEETEDRRPSEGCRWRIARARPPTGASPSWSSRIPCYCNGSKPRERIVEYTNTVRIFGKGQPLPSSARRARGGARACGAGAEGDAGVLGGPRSSFAPSRSSRDADSESVARKRSSTSQGDGRVKAKSYKSAITRTRRSRTISKRRGPALFVNGRRIVGAAGVREVQADHRRRDRAAPRARESGVASAACTSRSSKRKGARQTGAKGHQRAARDAPFRGAAKRSS